MRPESKVKVHGHHTISFETIQKIEWHLANLPDLGWQTIIEVPKKKHLRFHARKRMKKPRGRPVYFGRVILGYERGIG